VLFRNGLFGKMLMLDGATQVTTRDEFVYHEMMTHVPILAHGAARHVLIIGGGDCGIAEEVVKHAGVERITQVEIDASVVEFAKEHFPEFTKPVFADKRFDSVIDDGMKYVARQCRLAWKYGEEVGVEFIARRVGPALRGSPDAAEH
jgi:spermidine synthase